MSTKNGTGRVVTQAVLFAMVAMFVPVFGMAVYAHYFVPGSALFTDEMLFLRILWVVISSVLAGALVRYLRIPLRTQLSSKVSVSILAFTIAILSSIIYFHLQRFVYEWLNPTDPFGFSGHDSLNLYEMLLVSFISFTASTLVVFLLCSISLNLFRWIDCFRRLK